MMALPLTQQVGASGTRRSPSSCPHQHYLSDGGLIIDSGSAMASRLNFPLLSSRFLMSRACQGFCWPLGIATIDLTILGTHKCQGSWDTRSPHVLMRRI